MRWGAGAFAGVVLGATTLAQAQAPTDTSATALDLRDTPRGRIVGRAEIGFDSYEESYSIVEEDTLDAVNEWRSRLRLGWAMGSLLGNYFLVEGRVLAGQGNYETAGRLRLHRRFGSNPRTRFSFDGVVSSRGFDESSSFSYPNDYLRYFFSAYVQWGIGPRLSLRLSDRYEQIDFEERTEFDFDSTRNGVTLSGEYAWDVTTFVTGAVRVNTMSIPDSTEIEYRSVVPYLELRSSPDVRQQVYVQAAVERREYTSPTATRNDFWAALATLTLEWPLARDVTLGLADDFEHYAYDGQTEAYFDYVENRTLALVNYYPMFFLRLSAGGAFALLSAGDSPQDEYREAGAVLAVEYSQGTRLWLSLQYEPGRRVYPAFDPDAIFDFESVFSDYAYHRISVFGTWRMWRGLAFNAFVDYQPEDHAREGDDATATLITVSLSYLF